MATILRAPFVVPRPAEQHYWLQTPKGSATLRILTSGVTVYGAPGQAPTKAWRYDYDTGSASWIGAPTARNPNVLTPAVAANPFIPPPWDDIYSEPSIWTGTPDGSAVLAQLLTAAGKVKPKFWLFGQDDASVWNAKPTGSAVLGQLLTVGGQVKVNFWKFGLDTTPEWTGRPQASPLLLPLLTAAGQVKARFWSFGRDDSSFWTGSPQTAQVLGFPTAGTFYGAAGQVPTKLWRYDYQINEPIWVGAPTANGPIIVGPPHAPIPPTSDVGARITGGSFSRKKWHELKSLREAEHAAKDRAVRLKRRHREAVATAAKAAREAIEATELIHAQAEIDAQLKQLALAVEAASQAKELNARLLHAHAAELQSRLIQEAIQRHIDAEIADEDEALALLMMA